ncbi:MAG TPA: alpha/beta hydrolase [Dehalococcoidia bacterium]|nr:alpha/beta hydrolase [Dehalococcoidia bacterium]
MATFVLVHGAWTGGFVWRRVSRFLRQLGHDVFSPTLTGLGERVHLSGRHVDLRLHVTDILNVLEYEDLRDVVLVGHSYGGMVVSMVADAAPDRIRHLVYLDAFVPDDGESVQSLRGEPPLAGDWVAPPSLAGNEARLARLLALSHLSLQPRATFEQPAVLAQPLETRRFARTYVLAMGREPPSAQKRAASRAKSDPRWRYFEIEAGHDLMLTAPECVADLLHNIAACCIEGRHA